MEASKRRRLEAKGWKVGDAADFLALTPEEAVMVEIRLALSRSLKERRRGAMMQAALAMKIGSSQPRVAMAENGDGSVSIELLMRSLLATGVTAQEIGQIIAAVGLGWVQGADRQHLESYKPRLVRTIWRTSWQAI
jgi:transcriptional regulator with XRE-family HTH domain